jgi:hypothetical protein
MSNSGDTRKDGIKRNAQYHFAKTEQREVSQRKERQTAQDAVIAKTAKLRALRLAKEAVDIEEAAKLPAKIKKRTKRVAAPAAGK